MTRLTTIKRHNIFVVGVSVIIAASFWIAPLLKNSGTVYRYELFKTVDGWGYDILVNDSLQIHQDFIPAIAAKNAFPEKQQAKKAAELVILKLKSGKHPGLSQRDLENIIE